MTTPVVEITDAMVDEEIKHALRAVRRHGDFWGRVAAIYRAMEAARREEAGAAPREITDMAESIQKDMGTSFRPHRRQNEFGCRVHVRSTDSKKWDPEHD